MREADFRYYSQKGNERIEKGVIRIADIEMLGDLGNYKGRKSTFALQTPTRTYYLDADSKEEKKQWLEVIRQRIESWSKLRDKEGNIRLKVIEVEAASILKLISKLTDTQFCNQSIFKYLKGFIFFSKCSFVKIPILFVISCLLSLRL